MLISDPAARAHAQAEKRRKILAFLGDEVWTSAAILGRVAGIQARQAVHRTLTALEADGLIHRAPAPVLRGQGVTVWGLTAQGRALCPDAAPIGPTFEPSKLRLERVPHQLMLQELRLVAEAAGWTDWTRGEALGKDVAVRPDALVTRPDGHRVALEAERSVKTPKRYQSVIAAHLAAIQGRQWVGVYYVSPPLIAGGLARIFDAIQALPGGAAFGPVQRSRIKILTPDQWPPGAPQQQEDAA